MNNNPLFRAAGILCAVLALQTPAIGQSASGEFNLQGRLTSTTGSPVADGQHTIQTTVYAKGSSQIVYTETDNVVTVGGIFSTKIGDNGAGGSTLNVDANSDYEVGITVDAQPELSPKISLGSSVKSITANLAADAKAVGGFGVSTMDSAKANTIVALGANGKIRTSLLDSNVVTSVNGVHGAVNFTGGGDLAVNTSGNTVNLAFTGSGSGTLAFPFSKTLNLGAGTGFQLTNTLGGSAATFINSGLGTALDVQAITGSAISASSTGSITGEATVNISNSTGTALRAVANSGMNAVVRVKNLSSSVGAALMSMENAAGDVVLDVAANGRTTVRASVDKALDISTSAGSAISATANTSTDAVVNVKNQSSAAGAKLMRLLDANSSAVVDIAASGKTTINAGVAGALDVTTSAGAAIEATSTSATGAVVNIKNQSAAAGAKLISAVDAGGNVALDVAASGKTTIRSTVGDALDVSTSVAGEAAMKVNGGLKLVGPVGTGTIGVGLATTTITNAHVKANSIILVTVNGVAATAVPVMVSTQGTGTFVVSTFGSTVLSGAVSFSYLVINQ